MGYNFTENIMFDKKCIKLIFSSKDDLYCVKG